MGRKKKDSNSEELKYVISDKYVDIMEKIIDKYYDQFGHIKSEEILILEDISTDKREKAVKIVFADVSLVPPRSRDVYKQTVGGIPKKYYMTIYSAHCENLSENQMKLLIFHELLHIGEDGKLLRHNFEDFLIMVDNFGSNYIGGNSSKAQPDILSSDFTLKY